MIKDPEITSLRMGLIKAARKDLRKWPAATPEISSINYAISLAERLKFMEERKLNDLKRLRAERGALLADYLLGKRLSRSLAMLDRKIAIAVSEHKLSREIASDAGASITKLKAKRQILCKRADEKARPIQERNIRLAVERLKNPSSGHLSACG